MERANHELHELLSPSIEPSIQATSIYSARASFFVAFLGGPFAIIVFTGLNSSRLRRLTSDAWMLGGAALIAVAYMAWLIHMRVTETTPEWLEVFGASDSSQLRNSARILALLLFAGFYFAHRRFHRASQLRSDDLPSPWAAGIAATAVGLVATMVVAMAVSMVVGAS